jgi:hypothetical protein
VRWLFVRIVPDSGVFDDDPNLANQAVVWIGSQPLKVGLVFGLFLFLGA